ncbi:MAG: ImmA/IrrE family metallo-endopeptidase [Phycisphaerae bacterium]|nr:ImmA/IrrE family metallo-endopeptidase [Phycisphaerae bacterium]
MKREQVKQLADDALNTLAEALEQGKSEALTDYLAMVAKFHQYSFRNIMLIASQRPDACRVAGFNTWRKLGRFVKKGEKGIVIIAPMVFKKQDAESGSDEEGRRLWFRAAYVFDVSQTDGEPLPEPGTVSGDPAGYAERLKAFIAVQGIRLEYADTLGGADGRSHGGRIELLKGLTPAAEFSTLAHELAHEMMHHGEKRDGSTRTSRETEAEAVAFVVCRAIGLETSTAAQDYIQFHDGNTETLAAALDRIQHTAAAIIEAVTEEPQTDAQAA